MQKATIHTTTPGEITDARVQEISSLEYESETETVRPMLVWETGEGEKDKRKRESATDVG
jgi:hypothetical protein